MIVIFATLFGVALGAWRAKTRGGRGMDMAQYAAGHAIAFALLALFATIILERLL
ncbi:MAG: apolipoprotein acyltransferase [Celeribacter sp.]|jgi:hypothetical protein